MNQPTKNPSPRGRNAQALAFQALWRVEVQDAYADIVLDHLFRKTQATAGAKALATEITMGALRHRTLIDHHLKQFADRPLKKLDRRALIALRIGAYQLVMLDRVPDHAAVNQTVSLAPESARGLVNALLRAIAGKAGALKAPDVIRDETTRLAVTYSHPEWMVRDWVERLGAPAAALLMAANNQRPALTLRVNDLRLGREAFLRLLKKEGIEAEPGRFSPLAVVIRERSPIEKLPGYGDGLFAVQDESSQLPALVLGPRKGELILDACAAPGTKSLQIMQMMSGRGRVAAVDIHAGRLQRMGAESLRLGLKNVTRITGDASRPHFKKEDDPKSGLPERFFGTLFDRVLADAPCTGLGTIRRRPEIKWKRKPEDIGPRAELQRAILDHVSGLVKKGGVLVYSTCTFTVEENEEVVSPLVQSGRFVEDDPAEGLPQLAPLVENKMLRAWPHLCGSDGFTVFRLRRVK